MLTRVVARECLIWSRKIAGHLSWLLGHAKDRIRVHARETGRKTKVATAKDARNALEDGR